MQDGALARQAPASDKGRLTPLGLVSGRRAAISVQIDWRLWEQVVAGECVPPQAFTSLTTLSAARERKAVVRLLDHPWAMDGAGLPTRDPAVVENPAEGGSFIGQIDFVAQQCHANPPLDPAHPVRLPGEQACRNIEKAVAGGVPVSAATAEGLAAWASRLGVDAAMPA